MNNTKFAACVTLLAGVVATPFAVQASPVTVDFTVTSSLMLGNDYPVGTVGTGYFTFDDSLMPLGGAGVVGSTSSGAPTLDLSFNWFGSSFDELTAGIGTLSFTNGVLTNWLIGGNYAAPTCGVNVYGCVSSTGGILPDFMVNSSELSWFNDGAHYGLGSGYNAVSWSVRSSDTESPTSVPEPASLLLFGLGMVGVSLARRKKAA